MTDWRTELGQRIRQIREASEVTQRELANRCGLSSRDSLARLEAGKGELINLLLLREIGMMAIQQSRDANWLLCLPPGVQRLWSIDEMASATREQLAGYMARLSMSLAVVRQMYEAGGEPAARAALASAISAGLGRVGEPQVAAAATAARSPSHAGYSTVTPETVAGADWWRRYVPIIGRIAAGAGMPTVEASSYPPGWCGEYLAFQGAPASAIAVRVTGASMEPQYRDGDIVVVDTAQPVRAGVCCILLDAGGGEREAVVKRLSLKGDQATLASLNRCYPPRTLPAAGIVAAYRIIAHLPRST